MPELPEVESVKKYLKCLKNKKILDTVIRYDKIIESPSVEEFKKIIKNSKIQDINRRGKWLIFDLNKYVLLSHLRMEGKYRIKNANTPYEKHDHIIFKLDDKTELRYNDTRKFGRMFLLKKEEMYNVKPLCELGLEPWDNNLTKEYLKEKLKNKSLPIKTVLLDQSIMVGNGNIYADEVLFLSKINPIKRANTLSLKELDNIINNTKKVLEEAILNGGTTIRTYESSEGVHGNYQDKLNVHGKKICPNCNNKIEKIIVGTRGTYYCPNCQK